MATQTMASECIGKYFITAILLSSNVKRAEAAVLNGIQSMDLDQTATSACGEEGPDDNNYEFKAAAALLPAELQRVLQLTRDLRRCFVLRMLVGMSRERCAALLDIDVAQVDQGTYMAVTELARVADSKYGDSHLPLSSHFDLLPSCYL